MHPQSLLPNFRTLTLIVAATLATAPGLRAQQDVPPVNIAEVIQALKALREQQTTQLRSQKQTAIQQLSSVAGSPEKSIQLWEDAIRATQFDGMAKEGAQFRAWKEGEGEALKERLVANAVHLHLTWLVLTLQHSAGAKVKDLLPSVVNYTKELVADEAAMEALAESIKREREAAAIAPPGGGNRRNQNQPNKVSDAVIKRTHDQIMRPLSGSPVVKWMKLEDAVGRPQGNGPGAQGRGGRRGGGGGTADAGAGEQWEDNPGNLDGIFQKIILPELRTQKDARVLEYWDLKLKKEADAASRSRLAYEIEKFNTERRPQLLWSRSQEFIELGQKNRAITEMFAVIKAHPTHAQADEWISALEQLLMPAAPATPAADSTTAAPTAPVPVPGL